MKSDKPLLLVFPHEEMAHYLRCLYLAKYLQPYYTIQFLYSSRYYLFVEKAGYETFACRTLDAVKVLKLVSCFDFSWLNELDLNSIYYDQLRVITELKAAAVLGDMAPTLKMAAEKTGIRYFSLINGYMSKYYAFVRRMPKKYPLFKLFHLLPPSLFQYFTNVGEGRFFHDMHRPFSEIRKREGLAAKYSYMQELEGDNTLICDLPELFPQKNAPENYHFIPPLFHQLDELQPAPDSVDPDKKTIFVSMGSTGNWSGVSFLNNPEYLRYNLITAGDVRHIIKGPNVISFPFINSRSVFAITDLLICHGGNGTVYQALNEGLPLLCKTSHLEQDYNLDGLERLQLGRSLDDVGSDEELLAIIEEWMEKKGKEPFPVIKEKIATATRNFQHMIDEIVVGNIEKIGKPELAKF